MSVLYIESEYVAEYKALAREQLRLGDDIDLAVEYSLLTRMDYLWWRMSRQELAEVEAFCARLNAEPGQGARSDGQDRSR